MKGRSDEGASTPRSEARGAYSDWFIHCTRTKSKSSAIGRRRHGTGNHNRRKTARLLCAEELTPDVHDGLVALAEASGRHSPLLAPLACRPGARSVGGIDLIFCSEREKERERARAQKRRECPGESAHERKRKRESSTHHDPSCQAGGQAGRQADRQVGRSRSKHPQKSANCWVMAEFWG